MTYEINPSVANGEVKAPPSKSMAHRNLICGAFSEKSIIRGVDLSKDIEATLSCLRSLGAYAEYNMGTVEIGGLSAEKKPEGAKLWANESGSTLRFMIPICLLSDKEITVSGADRLFERPLEIYEDICREKGLTFIKNGSSVTVKGPLKSGEFTVPGDVSSQFISGLLFALPNVCGDSIIHITGKLESASYIDLTVSALESFGVKIERPDEKTFVVKGSSSFNSMDTEVEGDYSNAAFFEALNFLGGSVQVTGLKENSKQGDRVYTELFKRIEAKDFPIDISDCPDLAPILFTVAAAKGEGYFTGTRRLKIKESDRAEVMKTELEKFGAEVTVDENEVKITCKELKKPDAVLSSHNDHRIVMSMAVLSSLTGGIIEGAEAVSKSFPSFFEKLSSLGVKVEQK